jgi:proton-dependent oligopeptide transporter, POT family
MLAKFSCFWLTGFQSYDSSFYGMKAILVVFMMDHMRTADGTPDPMPAAEAREWFHMFTMAAYIFPLLGAVISDAVLGKYATIIYFSVVYCLGHLCLALNETRIGLMSGLALIAVGAGGIKPCVSAHVGDQVREQARHHARGTRQQSIAIEPPPPRSVLCE